VDDHGGFAVECEWALALLLAGRAVRVPRPMYFKRLHPPSVESVSTTRWSRLPQEEIHAAWRRHRERMLRPLAGLRLTEPSERLLSYAAEAAMLRRLAIATGGPLPPEVVADATALLARLRDFGSEDRGQARALSMTLTALAAHHTATGDVPLGERMAEEAIRFDPSAVESLLQLGRSRLGQGRAWEALELVCRAVAAAPGASSAASLLADISQRLAGGAEAAR
jgi:hypothetical protein